MPSKNHRVLGILLLVIFCSLLLAACETVETPELDREAGAQAREEVDSFLDDAGEFVAGFCGSSAAPVALVGLVAVAWHGRRPQ